MHLARRARVYRRSLWQHLFDGRLIFGAHGHDDFTDGGRGGELTNGADQDGHAIEVQELLAVGTTHAGAETGGGKNYADVHRYLLAY